MSTRKVLADNIRHYRMALGLSQEQLAERAGMHRTYVGEIEQQRANVCLDNIEKVADALDVDIALLFLKDAPYEPIANVRVARKHPPKLSHIVAVCEWGDGQPSIQVVNAVNADKLSHVVYRVVQNPDSDALGEGTGN